MKPSPDRARFLRAAVKTGRTQHLFSDEPSTPNQRETPLRSEGVTTLRKIRASLQKRKSQSNPVQ